MNNSVLSELLLGLSNNQYSVNFTGGDESVTQNDEPNVGSDTSSDGNEVYQLIDDDFNENMANIPSADKDNIIGSNEYVKTDNMYDIIGDIKKHESFILNLDNFM